MERREMKGGGNNMKKIVRNTMITVGIILAFAILLIIIGNGNPMKANVIKNQQEEDNYSQWLVNNCDCVTYGKILCPDGFNLEENNTICISKTAYTSTILGCSEYNCSGQIKLWDNVTETWQK
jgi:hypothetical protein